MEATGTNSVKLTETGFVRFDYQTLDDLASDLGEEGQEREQRLRQDYVSALGRVILSRFEIGRVLSEYKKLYKPGRIWGYFCKAINVDVKTAGRMIVGFERAQRVNPRLLKAAADEGIDLAETKHRPLLEAVVELSPAKGFGTDFAAGTVLKKAKQAVGERKAKNAVLSIRDRSEQVYHYVTGAFKDVPESKREAVLQALYQRINSHFGIGKTMTVPFAASPNLIGNVGREKNNGAELKD
jgi:hypothetical protein